MRFVLWSILVVFHSNDVNVCVYECDTNTHTHTHACFTGWIKIARTSVLWVVGVCCKSVVFIQFQNIYANHILVKIQNFHQIHDENHSFSISKMQLKFINWPMKNHVRCQNSLLMWETERKLAPSSVWLTYAQKNNNTTNLLACQEPEHFIIKAKNVAQTHTSYAQCMCKAYG